MRDQLRDLTRNDVGEVVEERRGRLVTRIWSRAPETPRPRKSADLKGIWEEHLQEGEVGELGPQMGALTISGTQQTSGTQHESATSQRSGTSQR